MTGPDSLGLGFVDAGAAGPGDGLRAGPVGRGMRSGEQVASTLARFATVVPDEAWTELDAC